MQPSYKKFYTSPWGIAFIAYFLAMGLVGAFTPADILKANLWAREFCDFMAGIVPQIDAVTKLNIAPDINRFYFSVMWAGSPLLVIWTLMIIFKGGTDPTINIWSASFLKMLSLLIFPALCAYAFMQFDVLVSTQNRLILTTFDTHLGRATLGSTFVIGPVFFGTLIATCFAGGVLNLFGIKITRSKKNG